MIALANQHAAGCVPLADQEPSENIIGSDRHKHMDIHAQNVYFSSKLRKTSAKLVCF